MIQAIAGTEPQTMRLLQLDTLNPRDETLFYRITGFDAGAPVWEIEGQFLDSGYAFHFRHVGEHDEIPSLVEAIRRNRAYVCCMSLDDGSAAET